MQPKIPQRNKQEERSRLRLQQLLVSLGLFLSLYMGQGVYPEMELARLIGAQTDFRGAFLDFGNSLAQEESFLGTVGEFCITVFGESEPEQVVEVFLPIESQGVKPFEDAVSASHYFGLEFPEETVDTQEPPEVMLAPEEDLEEDIPPVGEVMASVPPTGTTLPTNHSLDKLSLGGLEFTTPLLGRVTSPYGPRVSAIASAVHSGVDVAGGETLEIVAFADGVVTASTEGESAGLYIRIDHGNEIGTLYAHCSELLVEEGQSVKMGEPIAIMGDTGNAVGAHLHFEVTCQGVYLNPLHYISYLTE
ncbi:MAG: M23 family metallopeptidase [Eubacteriales bacterium]